MDILVTTHAQGVRSRVDHVITKLVLFLGNETLRNCAQDDEALHAILADCFSDSACFVHEQDLPYAVTVI